MEYFFYSNNFVNLVNFVVAVVYFCNQEMDFINFLAAVIVS